MKLKEPVTMRFRLLLSFALLYALPLSAFADTTIVDEDFESYNNDTELLAAWPSSGIADNGLTLVDVSTVIEGADGADFLELQRTNPDGIAAWQSAFGPDKARYPGIDGKAAQFCGSLSSDACDPTGAGTVNNWGLNFPVSVIPTETQNVELSVDIGDDALSANKKLTIGLRSASATQNILEMGLYNGPVGFAYRAVIFFASDIEASPQWVGFDDATKIDTPLDPDLNSQAEVGAGFHTYKAVIGVDQIVFSLDLYADGVTNDPANPVPGVGTPGVDASDTVFILTTAAGFDNLRIGIPSASASSGGTNPDAAFAAFDNISLKLVDIPLVTSVPEPTSALLALLAATGLLTTRRR